MRNFLALIVFIFVILLIGRNLTFLPKFDLFSYQENKTNKTDEIKTQIKEIILKQKGSYSVYFFDLNSGDSFGINDKQIHTAASLNKMPIIAVLYYLVNKGVLDLDEKITLQKEDIQDYGTGSLRYEKPGNVYSLRTLAKLSLQKSDNTASYIIATKIGIDNIQKIINDWGLRQTDMVNNKTSVYDMFVLFKKIYKGEITNNSATLELLDFLTESDTEDRLPLLLEKETKVYHKTGNEIGNIHDAGIIKKNKAIFFLGVMTSDIGERESETKKTIAEIAKKVYDFENKEK